jgi:hypothetical protein
MGLKENEMKISFRDVLELLFIPILSAAVFLLWDLNKSIGALNLQVGVLLEQNMTTKERFVSIERRLEKLEDAKRIEDSSTVINLGNVARKK